MSDSNAVRAGKAYVEVGLKGLKKLDADFKKWGKNIATVGTKLLGAGLVGGTALAGMGKAFADMGSDIYDMSKRTGMSTEAISEFAYAAKQTGTDIKSVETGIKKMQKVIGESGQGSKEANNSLAQLGLTYQDLQGIAPEEQFKLIASQLDKIQDPALKTTAALEVFGKSGTDLLPMLEGGAEALASYAKEAASVGAVMDETKAIKADALGDSLDKAATAGKMALIELGAAVAPAMTKMAEAISGAMSKVSLFIAQNQWLGDVLIKGVGIAAIAGGGMMVLGKAMAIVVPIIKGLGSALSFIVPLMKMLGAAAAVIVSPLGLLGAGIAVAGAAFLAFTEQGNAVCSMIGEQFSAAFSWLTSMFSNMVSEFSATWDAIKGYLAAGDLGKAAATGLAYLEIVFWEVSKACVSAVGMLVKYVLTSFPNAVDGAINIWFGLREAFSKVTSSIQGLWYDLCLTFQVAWNGAGAYIEMGWNYLRETFPETTAFLENCWTDYCSSLKTDFNIVSGWLEKRMNELQKVFDDTFDAEAANRKVDEITNAANTQYEQERQKAQVAKDAYKNFDAGKANEKIKQRLEQSNAQAMAEYNQKDEARKAALNDEIEALKKQRQAAKDEAARLGREGLDSVVTDIDSRIKSKKDELSKLQIQAPKENPVEEDIGGFGRMGDHKYYADYISKIDPAKALDSIKISQRGTFSGAEARGWGMASNRTEQAVVATAEIMKDMKVYAKKTADAVGQGLVWG